MAGPVEKGDVPASALSLPSDAEIAVIEALAAQAQTVIARLPSGKQAFRTRLLHVDQQRQFVLIQASNDLSANASLLAAPQVVLLAELDEWRIEITSDDPRPASRDGVRAIQLAFPHAVEIKRRRLLERTPVPPKLSLRCVAHVGGEASFAGIVTDVSQGGIGLLQEFSKNPLHPGMELSRYQLECPGRDRVEVDLKVRFVGAMTGDDGPPRLKIGCQFVNPSAQALALIGEFARGNS
jgi:c-di-GMP-binding flagellar brake protein YcgR